MTTTLLRSIFSVLIGFISVAVLSVCTDKIFESIGIFPPQATPEAYTTLMLFTALMYRSAYTVLGGYITARLAPKNMMMHVVVLMVLGGIGGIAGAIGGWQLGNHWYPVVLAITGPAFVWLGGVVGMRRV